MKLVIAVLALIASVASAVPEIGADSIFGKNLLAHARRLDQEESFDWVSGYSIKFQGCTAIKQWNDEADGDEDVRIATKNLVRFRLCPASSCSATKAAGCTAGYGDYVVDMDTFMESYFEAVREQSEYACDQYMNTVCNCDGDEYCQYDCFNAAEMYQCIERNPYQADEAEEEAFSVDNYMQCAELQIPNNERRRLDQEEVKYYVGPYCSNEGGQIFLGLFTDDTCTTMASGVTFYDLMGFNMPYDDTSIVDSACVSCLEPVEADEQNEGDAEDADAVLESCENIYSMSGKCEANLPSGMVSSPNNAACNYMEGIRIVRQDGIIDVGSSRPSAVATSFIVISAMAFVAMGFYVWYLRTRLGVKKDTLL